MDISLNLDQLREEIDFLRHTYNIKRAVSALSCHSKAVTNKQKDRRSSGSVEHYVDSVRLLMDWVNAVCAFYNKQVSLSAFVLTYFKSWLKSNECIINLFLFLKYLVCMHIHTHTMHIQYENDYHLVVCIICYTIINLTVHNNQKKYKNLAFSFQIYANIKMLHFLLC